MTGELITNETRPAGGGDFHVVSFVRIFRPSGAPAMIGSPSSSRSKDLVHTVAIDVEINRQ